jgi:hypothetical protein
MDTAHLSLLFLAVGVIAFLYSSVGHAGASGYIAVMALWGLAATTIRPTALILNILVATIGSFQFWKPDIFLGNYSGLLHCFPYQQRISAAICNCPRQS